MRTVVPALAVALAAHVHGEEVPTVFGFQEGEPMPADSEPLEGAVLTHDGEGKAGLDAVIAWGTVEHGVCKVTGRGSIDKPRGDTHGIRHKALADEWRDRMQNKLRSEPTDSFNNVTASYARSDPSRWALAMGAGKANYAHFWSGDEAKPFKGAAVQVRGLGIVVVEVEFQCWGDVMADHERRQQAEF